MKKPKSKCGAFSALTEIIIYESDSGQPNIEVRIEGDTVWLTQTQLVELFDSSKANVSEHIKHIFDEGELQRDSVVRKFRTTAKDGKNYNVEYYNLDLIISLGYRVKSQIATKFFTGKCSTCSQPVKITIPRAKNPAPFSRWCRINSTMRHTATPPPK